MLLKSTIMSKWELEAILQLLQVMERSKSSKIFDKSSSIQGPLQKSKIKMQNIYLWIVFCQNAFWNQKTLCTRSGHPCTVSAIFPWQWQVSFNGLGISYRDRQIHKPQVPRKWGEKIAFICLLQAWERKFLSSYSRNLGPVDMPIPVQDMCTKCTHKLSVSCCGLQELFAPSVWFLQTKSNLAEYGGLTLP